MNRLAGPGMLAMLLAIAGCATAPDTKPAAPAAAAVKPIEAPYRWTHGHAPKARQAMLAKFGRAGLSPGEYLWADSIAKEGETRLVIDLLVQMAYVYRGDQLVGAATISSGQQGKETPLGFWKILEKRRTYFSRKYDNAPMPWMQRIDEFGIALHGGKLPGFPASRGCVRLPMAFAEKLYGLTKVGTEVVIEG